MATAINTADARASIGTARLLIGLAQGVALLLLTEAQTARAWPATDPWFFGVLVLSIGYLPITVLAGIGQLRLVTLGLWIAASATLIGVVVWHANARDGAPIPETQGALFLLLPPMLFVAYHLVAASDADRRVPATYRSYFDIAWKNGVQLALSLAFLGTLWLLLYLGASLFELIRIGVFREIIVERWFYIPVSTTAFAMAAHLTDVRVGLIDGIRTVALVLLSWLLPVMTVLAVAFLAALPATGLEPLWATGSATAILLAASATLVVLVNAAYQYGERQSPPHAALKIAARIAGLALAALVAIAAYAVWLRVGQHGLTPERVVGLAVVAIAACYAAGYAVAALWPGRWFKPLELTNVTAGFVSLGLAIAMLTPVADPARLSVNDQLRRLRLGLVTPEAFDFDFLRFDTVRYGRDALEALARDTSTPRAKAIAERAQTTLKRDARTGPVQPSSRDLIAKIVVRPSGRLPDSFISQDWSKSVFAPTGCVRAATAAAPCHAYFLDIDGDGAMEILVGTEMTARYDTYQLSSQGGWNSIGHFDMYQCGVSLPTFLDLGRHQLVPAKQREIEIDGKRLRLQGCAQ